MDEFRKGSREWGSKARKDEKRKCRNRLKRLDAKEPRKADPDPTNPCDLGICDDCAQIFKEIQVSVDKQYETLEIDWTKHNKKD